jgi:hypothetical protein
MREGTTSRVVAADRPYSEFYDFYTLVYEDPLLRVCSQHTVSYSTGFDGTLFTSGAGLRERRVISGFHREVEETALF